MRRDRIDLSSDISFLLAQLRKLAASRLGRRLRVNELVFVDLDLAQAILDVDAAVEAYGDRELKAEWKRFRQRIVRKAALKQLKQLSETTRLFVAGAGRGESYEVEEEE